MKNWRRRDKDHPEDCDTFVSEKFVRTALQSALGVSPMEAAMMTDGVDVGASIETECFEYTRL